MVALIIMGLPFIILTVLTWLLPPWVDNDAAPGDHGATDKPEAAAVPAQASAK